MVDRIRILLGEDHALLREGTRQMLSQQWDLHVVGEAGDGEEVLSLAQRLRPDIAILDIRMPLMSAIEVTEVIRRTVPSTRVLILTAFDDDDLVLAAMDAGAQGYLLKTVRTAELIAAVRAIYRGETVIHPAVAQKIALIWTRRRAGLNLNDGLTPREVEVLQSASQGLRNKEIADSLGVSIRTVEGHLSSIMSKLGVSSRTAAVMQAASLNLLKRVGEEARR